MKKTLWVLLAAVVLVLAAGTVIFYSSPALISRSLSKWAANQGYDRIEHAKPHISFLEGSISVSDLYLMHSSETVLKVNRADIVLSLASLLRGQLRIKLIRLTGAKLQVQRNADSDFVVAGLTLGDKTSGGVNTLQIDLIHVVDGEIVLKLPHIQGTLAVHELRIVNGEHIGIEQIQLKNLQADITRTGSKSWQISGSGNTLSGILEADIADNNASRTDSIFSSLSLQVGTIEIIGNSSIRYQDTILGVAIKDVLLIDEAWVKGLDTRAPEQALTFLLREHSSSGVHSVWRGEVHPFKEQLEASVKTRIESVSLPLLSQLTATNLGLEISNGNAVMNLQIDISEGSIGGTLGLQLTDLQVMAADEKVLGVQESSIQVSLTELLKGELKIESADVNGVELTVERLDNGTSKIAGLVLGGDGGSFPVDLLNVVNAKVLLKMPQLETTVLVNDMHFVNGKSISADTVYLQDLKADISHSTTSEALQKLLNLRTVEPNKTDPDPGKPAPSVTINTIAITGNSTIRYTFSLFDVAVENVMIIDEARVTGLDTSAPEQALTFLLREHNPAGVDSIWQGTTYPFKEQPELSLEAQIESVSLPLVSKIAEKKLGLKIGRGKALVNLEVDVIGDKIDGTLGLQMTDFQVQKDGEDVVSGRKSEIRIALAELLYGQLKIKVADFDGVRLKMEHLDNGTNKIAGQIFGGGQQTQATNSIEALHITDGQLEFTAPAMQFTVHVNELQLNGGTHIDADVISFQDLKIGIIHTAHNDWQLTGENDGTRLKYGFGSKGYDPEAGENPLQGMVLKANRIELTGDSTFRFEDRSSALPLIRTMRFNRAWIIDINSENPESLSSLVLSMQSDQYGQLSLEGSAKLFTSPPELFLKGRAEAIRLTPLSSLTDERFGFDIETGQFDADIEIDVREHKIDGRVDMHINLLTVSPTDNDKIKAFEDSLYEGLKLHQMINLLTDEHGHMVIGLPVKGDPRAPTFDLDINMDSAVSKAITEITKIVIAPILTSIVREIKTRRRHVAALPFATGAYKLNKKAYQKLDCAAEKLTAHPERLVVICGSAGKDENTSPTGTDKKEHDVALFALAEQRASLVRRLLIEKYGIEARRLIDCRAKIKTSSRHLHVDIR